MSELRVLNAYAGIGGNRHLWSAEWHVTAVELDPRIAAEYARRYPQDTVIVGDAIRNAVVPIEGYDMAVAAFARELAHRSGEPVASGPACDCSCHTMPGVMHVAACCSTGTHRPTERQENR